MFLLTALGPALALLLAWGGGARPGAHGRPAAAGLPRSVVLVLSASAACSAAIGWLLPLGPGVVLPVAVVYGLLVTAESSTLSSAVAQHAPPGALGTTMALQ